MMQDDTITIHDKANTLYLRLEDLSLKGEITIEQMVILDDALSLWVEYREALSQREYDEWIRREMGEESRPTPEEMAELHRQSMEEEESRDDFWEWMATQVMEEEALVRGDFEDWPSQHDVDVAMSEYNREDV